MTRVAVLGANGFIGNRTVEMLHASDQFDVRPIVRRASAAALPRRLDLDVRVADGRDRTALAAALAGCDSLVVSVAGDPATIVGVIEPVLRAARRAGIQRLVYLSSASVNGQAPALGTDEHSPLSARQPLAYNNAKVAAEARLHALARSGQLETVILRPGIVFGPRSHWIGGWADEVLSGQAYVVDGAAGACNAIYVDNLVHAIVLALRAGGADGRAYLLGQHEAVTWRELYGPVCQALGVEFGSLPDYPFSTAQPEQTPDNAIVRSLKQALPKSVRVGLRAALRHHSAPAPSGPTLPTVSMERALLQTATYVPPWSRAKAELGYEPLVSFQEGLQRSIAWLSFAGYPVRTP